MLYKGLTILVATALLAGCGHAPLTASAGMLPGAGLAAKVDTSRHRHALVVPAEVMAFADDYMAKQHAQLDQGGTSVHFGVTLVASANDFKRTASATLDRSTPRAKDGSQTFMLDEDAPTGDLAYYLVVSGTVTTEKPNGLSVDSLKDFFVSNYGKNFRATVK